MLRKEQLDLIRKLCKQKNISFVFGNFSMPTVLVLNIFIQLGVSTTKVQTSELTLEALNFLASNLNALANCQKLWLNCSLIMITSFDPTDDVITENHESWIFIKLL